MSWSDTRLRRLRQIMADESIDLFAVRSTSNICWLTDFDDVFDEEQAHLLLVFSDHALLHTDSRYATACEQAAKNTAIKVDTSVQSHNKVIAANLAPGVKLAIESSIPLSEFRNLEEVIAAQAEQSFEIFETKDVVIDLRAVKDAKEITRLRNAQAITDAAFSYIIEYMKPGMTERDVQLALDSYMMRHGAWALAFPTIVASGPHAASPHAIAGDTVLEAGQCVVMDFGARVCGYDSDMTRTVFLGAPDAALRQAYEVVREANERVENLLRPGISGAEAHQLAEDILAEGGFAGRMGHGLGHGVGIDIHEQPVLSRRNKKPLVAGNVVTVEPGIYLPGRFGMRLEDFGVVTSEGFEVFSQSTHELVII